MENDRPRKDQIFNIAAEIADPDLRAAYLGEACGDDTSLREQIERLLKHDQEDASFLESPPPGVDATALRSQESNMSRTGLSRVVRLAAD